MDEHSVFSHILKVSELSSRKPTRFKLEPEAADCTAIAESLGFAGVRKVRFEGALTPKGKSDWQLDAMLGATVIQSCVITLEPVTTRIDTKVERAFVSSPLSYGTKDEGEDETTLDDSSEELGEEIDLGVVLTEALALAAPDYPKAPDAALDETNFTEPGKQAMTDEEARPFAALAALRDKLEKDS